MVSLTLKRNGLKYRKRRKCPKDTQGQLLRIPRCCRQLRRVYFADGKSIILDDEKYFTLANSEMKGNDGFYTNNLEECPDNVKFKAKAKFADKILVWCAISNRGISRPFVRRVRGEALNSQGYIENCLSKLLQFVQEHHAEDDIMFWPDLASCHYSRDTQNWLRQRRIPFVPKNANPPNLPQARPIEDFWALLSRKVYDRGWEAQNEQQLRRRIFEKLRGIDLNSVQGLNERHPKKVASGRGKCVSAIYRGGDTRCTPTLNEKQTSWRETSKQTDTTKSRENSHSTYFPTIQALIFLSFLVEDLLQDIRECHKINSLQVNVSGNVNEFTFADSYKNKKTLNRPCELTKTSIYNRSTTESVARTCGISATTVKRVLRKQKFHPYKMQYLQCLTEDDPDRRNLNGQQYLDMLEDLIHPLIVVEITLHTAGESVSGPSLSE
ncbi:hypothetical protein NQ318_021647 [Aromia moschata]|uniref:Transposase n=1 Tax=Aromia moschata TaxID=1265417 RepID=A0AAV8XU23_9CUCU|nr:hypothetical protein NQ318_021647 [Aromia moschata]